MEDNSEKIFVLQSNDGDTISVTEQMIINAVLNKGISIENLQITHDCRVIYCENRQLGLLDRKHSIKVIGPKDNYTGDYINVTSRSKDWGKELSPFNLPGTIAKCVENAWQFSKVYDVFVDSSGNPTPEYFTWAQLGFQLDKAVRYPMGRGKKPLYSYWKGQKLSYVEARKHIYIPIYASAAFQTEAYQRLLRMYNNYEPIVLWDFDGYDNVKYKKSYADIINDVTHPLGHAFVIAMMLTGMIKVCEGNIVIYED